MFLSVKQREKTSLVNDDLVSLSYEELERLESHSVLAYDVKFGWQSLVCNLQSVGARVTEAQAVSLPISHESTGSAAALRPES